MNRNGFTILTGQFIRSKSIYCCSTKNKNNLNNLYFKLGQNKHHLSHHFDKYNGVNMFVGEQKPGTGGAPLPGQDLRAKNSVYPRGKKKT